MKFFRIHPFSFTIIPGFIFVAFIAAMVKPQAALSDNGKAYLMHQKANKTFSDEDYHKAIKIYETIINEYPQYSNKLAVYFGLAQAYRHNGNIAKLPKIYQDIIDNTPDAQIVADFQKRLYDVNMELIFSRYPTKDSVIYAVRSGDTLSKIAKRNKTTVQLIKKANHLKSDLIRVGQNLKVNQAIYNVLVDKSLNKLFLKKGEEVLNSYNISTGMNNSTPTGEYEVINKLINPTWYSLDAVVPPGSSKNILGSRWMGISLESYGIHGTTTPETIGQQNTAGCVRMRNSDVEELYTILPIGTTVKIIE